MLVILLIFIHKYAKIRDFKKGWKMKKQINISLFFNSYRFINTNLCLEKLTKLKQEQNQETIQQESL